ncbi:mutator type transposase [Tanacetum coccineum]
MYNKNQIQSLQQELLEGYPFPSQILTTVGVDANKRIYPVAFVIVEAESKASWCWFLNLLGEDLGIEVNFNYTFIFDMQKSQGARQADGARTVFSQAVVTSQQSQAPRQVAGARNASSQADGSSQQKKGPRQGAGARNASSQTVGSSQPSVAPSQASQGPSQHSAGPTQASQGPKQGFQAPRPTPYYGPQRLTKKSSIRQPSEKHFYAAQNLKTNSDQQHVFS